MKSLFPALVFITLYVSLQSGVVDFIIASLTFALVATVLTRILRRI
jgi:hypothetical protein